MEMPQLKGGAAIIELDDRPSLNNLTGDIVDFKNGKYSIKLRGHKEIVHIPKANLVELLKLSEKHADCESIRSALLEAARSQSDKGHLQQRILAMQLGDEFSYIFNRHTDPTGWDPIPEDQAQRALVRFLEVYYVGQGIIATGGRQLTSFHIALSPFYTHIGEGRIAGPHASTTGAVFNWCRERFNSTINFGKLDASLIFRAFSYVQHRLDFREEHDTLLNAFCVAFFVIQLLQGNEIETISKEEIIREAFFQYGTGELRCHLNHVLWCFCKVFLDLAIVVRDTVEERLYNLLLPEPYGATLVEQAKIANLLLRLRPESPASHLAAYISVMDTKDLVVVNVGADQMKDYMEAAYMMAVSGKEKADLVGDPFYQYLFHMIVAYWLPTEACASSCTAGEIEQKIRLANEFKEECKSHVPCYLLFQGKQHEKACQAAIEALVLDDQIIPKIDGYLYSSVRFCVKYYKPGGKYDRLAGRYKCANCLEPLLKTLRCARCGKIRYCNRACQKEHWKCHKKDCKPKKRLQTQTRG